MDDCPNISLLLARAGAAIGREPRARLLPTRVALLRPLLSRRNGFYAFDRSLHVFPIGSACEPSEIDLESWNAGSLWRGGYGRELDDTIFFAEDLFGEQFGLDAGGRIVRFKPETGEIQPHSDNVDEWARRILDGPEFETGFHFARQWTERNGPIASGRRLLPAMPFMLGGEFSLENLFDGDAAEGMRFRADLALQARGVPDGASVRLVIPERCGDGR